MDQSLSSTSVMGVPIVSTCRRGLVTFKTYQPLYALPASSKTNLFDRKHNNTLPVSIKNHVSLRPKLIEIMKRNLFQGAKILPLGREGRTFRRNFNTTDCEKLLHSSPCSIYTTAGAITGILFISTERVGFCSDKSLKMCSSKGEALRFQYKVSIPLGKVKGVAERLDLKRPSNKYVEIVTVDDFSFWFLGFPSYQKTLRCLLSQSHTELV